jgi:uncharacterized protein YybS (DUF2232 family)
LPVSAGAHERPEPRFVLWSALLSVLAFTAAALLPLASLPLLVVTPFPLAVLRLRGSLGNALLATAMAAALVGALLGPTLAIQLAAVTGPGLVLADAMARGRGMRRGTAWSMGFASFELGLAVVFAPARMAAIALAPWDEMRSAKFATDMQAYGLPLEQVQRWSELATSLRGAMEIVYPAFFLVMGAAIALGHALVLRLYLSRRDPGWLEGGEFENLRLPLALSVAFVLCGAAVLAPELRGVSYNVLLVLGFLYVLQGIAVVSYYARRLAAPPLLRAAVLLLVLVNPWAPQVLALLGLFDLWFDFRKWAEVEE